MADKTVSKHLINLEKYFALTQPVLQRAGKVFHELDQIEYDLGLIEIDETTATLTLWDWISNQHHCSAGDEVTLWMDIVAYTELKKRVKMYKSNKNVKGTFIDARYLYLES